MIKIVFIILFFAVNCWAAEYYVTQNGAGSHSGLSMANAWSWNDVKNCSTCYAAGDLVEFHGNFNIDLDNNGDLDISASGDASNGYIIFDGTNSSMTIVNTTVATMYFVHFGGSDFIDFRNFTVTTGSGNTVPIRIAGAGASDNVKFHGNDFNGQWGHGLYNLNGITNWEIYNNRLADTWNSSASSDAIAFKDADTVSIYNNIFHNWGHSAIGSMLTTATDVITNIDIYFNYFTNPDNGPYGQYPFDIVVGGGTGTITNTYFHHNMMEDIRSQIQVNSDYVYIYGNVLRKFQNCCEYATDTGCQYDPATPGSCYSDYQKIAKGIDVHSDSNHIYIFNNTMSDIAEAGIVLEGNPEDVYINNNILHNTANACKESDSPDGSQNPSIDSAIVKDTSYGLNNWEVKNNIIDTDINGTSADGDFDWPGEPPATVAVFEAAHSEASDNIDQYPGFSSLTQLWPDSATDPMVGEGRALTGTPYNTLPMYNQLINPSTTDFTVFPPVVNTVSQSTNWNIGAYALPGLIKIEGVSFSGVKIDGG
jgi:hypothetical protein